MTIALSELDGVLLTDEATLASCADDVGRLVHRVPSAVLRPGSVHDVVRALRDCHRRGVPVAVRGQGHSAGGQAQVSGGLVVDMSTLQGIGPLQDGVVHVEAGATWREVLASSVPTGWSPPVLTSFTGLSVGGTLSMGGVGAASFRHGTQVDHVLELEVVTGTGDLLRCSPDERPELFSAVLGGVGQYGVIVGATLPLVRVPPRVRYHVLGHRDTDAFFADLRTLAADPRVDGLYGRVVPGADGGWTYLVHAVESLPAGFHGDASPLAAVRAPAAHRVQDMDTLAFDTLVDVSLMALGHVDLTQVWTDVFLPGSRIEAFLAEVLGGLRAEELGPAGFVLLFPVRNTRGPAALRLPDEEEVFLLDVITSGPPGAPDFAPAQLARARSTYERARALGGTLYPIGSTPLTRADWQAHHGPGFEALREIKQRYDPAHILAPGSPVF
jgi:cytokinin dehydrogenase